MLKSFVSAVALTAALVPTVAMAQIPAIGISSGSTVLDIKGVSRSNMETWGEYNFTQIAVEAGVSGSAARGLTIGGLSLGGLAGLEVLTQEGGYHGQTYTRTNFTGQSVSSFTNF